jgi:hypothetical protein
MKNIIFEKYNLINFALFSGVSLVVIALYFYVSQGYCSENCSLDFKKGVMNPVFLGGRWLAGTLGVLLFFPSRIFRRWLFYIAPVVILATYYLAQGISIHTQNFIFPDRAEMAEDGMMLLAVITVVFVIGHLVYDRRKKKTTLAA